MTRGACSPRRAAAIAVAVASGALVLFASRAAFAACQGRPTDPSGFQGYTYGSAAAASFAGARVRVHYATSGANVPDLATTRADTVPDTVALAADAGDRSLVKFAEMGFKQPPGDDACTSSGGDAKLDIYLVAFAGADGTTVAESCSGRQCASFVLVDSTFAGRGYPTVAEGFRTVVSHEIFHAVQNGYDAEMDRFWAEGTAQWAMKSVFPEVIDFERQLPAFFKDSARSLDTQPSGVTAGFLYGAAVWPLFLTQRHGTDTVREIFEKQLDGTKAIAATDLVLAGKGSSVAADYPLFGAYNAATRSLAAEGGYPDAAKYPGVKIDSLEEGVSGITSGLSYFVYRGTLEALSSISIEGDAQRIGGVAVPITGGTVRIASAMPLPAKVEGEVLVVIAGITTKKTDAPFTVHVGAAAPGPPPGSSGTPAPPANDTVSGGCTLASTAPSRLGASSGSGALLTSLALSLSLLVSRVRARSGTRVRSCSRTRTRNA